MYALMLVGTHTNGTEVRATLWAPDKIAAYRLLPVFVAINSETEWTEL